MGYNFITLQKPGLWVPKETHFIFWAYNYPLSHYPFGFDFCFD